MANCSKLVGQLPKNDVCLTQCYKTVQKEDVVSMIAENIKVHIGPRLLPDNPVVDLSGCRTRTQAGIAPYSPAIKSTITNNAQHRRWQCRQWPEISADELLYQTVMWSCGVTISLVGSGRCVIVDQRRRGVYDECLHIRPVWRGRANPQIQIVLQILPLGLSRNNCLKSDDIEADQLTRLRVAARSHNNQSINQSINQSEKD